MEVPSGYEDFTQVLVPLEKLCLETKEDESVRYWVKPEVLKWLTESCIDLDQSNVFWSINYHNRVTFWFKDADEAMLFKLAWGGLDVDAD